MESLVNVLRTRFPNISYREGSTFCWSPRTREVFYVPSQRSQSATWSLLHETAHALLGHIAYQTDFELVRMEVAAWEKAKDIGEAMDVLIDEDHVQDCLDTYRDWLCARSVCPQCNTQALQQANLRYYQCFNCHMQWKVTPSRFCRAYRSAIPTAARLHV